jgi:thiol-disulfide isomerase/thioredoxin
VAGELPRFDPGGKADADALARVDGRWAVDFAESDDAAVGRFEAAADGTVEGTFLTTTGDYRFLAGVLDGDRLRLSCFDGAHAFLFEARLAEDGTLAGDFWSRDSWHESWTARKDPTVELPDAFGLTRWVGGKPLDELVFPDLDGTARSLGDETLAGRARVLVIFGSWCPNCNDSTRLLVELDRKYRDRGLAIVGLAFEMTGEFERDARQVRRYAEHHGIDYPLLVAGVSDKAEASQAFPLLDRIRSYPTTIFLHSDGRVRAVHQGFAGPATGTAHEELRARFESLVQELLREGDS